MTGNPNGERRCPDDLVVRGQRAPLNELERHALAVHLDQCAECRAAAALATLFGAVPFTQPGDDDLIARVADKATRRPRRASRWAGLRVAAVVALVILTGGAATAALVVYRRSSEEPPVPPPLSAPPPARPGARTHVVPLTSPVEVPTVEPAVQPEPVAEPPRKRRPAASAAPAPIPAPAPTVVEEPTAASLFSEANTVRRSGDLRKAIALYQNLRQRFPASSQAMLSAISVGDLLLAESDAAGAITAYGAYLRGVPQGTLTEEALYGRARGLRVLGRNAEERQTWEELVQRFPRSAYQPLASRRLRELVP
jgi:hypothetical protein